MDLTLNALLRSACENLREHHAHCFVSSLSKIRNHLDQIISNSSLMNNQKCVLEVINFVIENAPRIELLVQHALIAWMISLLRELKFENFDNDTLLILICFANILLTSQEQHLVILGLECSTALYQITFDAILNQRGNHSALLSLFTELETLRKSVSSMLPTLSYLQRVHAVKFIERVLLELSADKRKQRKWVVANSIWTTRQSQTVGKCEIEQLRFPPEHAQLQMSIENNGLADMLDKTKIQCIVEDTMNTLVLCLFESDQRSSVLVSTLMSVERLITFCPDTRETLINAVVLLERSVRKRDVKHTISSYVSSSSVQNRIRSCLRIVLRMPDTSNFHELVNKTLQYPKIQESERSAGLVRQSDVASPLKSIVIRNQTVSIAMQNSGSKRTRNKALFLDAVISTSLGMMSLTHVVQSVLSSFKHLSHISRSKATPDGSFSFLQLHFEGLKIIQEAAARRQQVLEIERLRRRESMRVSEVPFGHFFNHSPRALVRCLKKTSTGHHRSNSSKILSLAIKNMIAKYSSETELNYRMYSIALISRSVIHIEEPYCDVIFDEICDLYRKDHDNHIVLVLQILYAVYASLILSGCEEKIPLDFDLSTENDLNVLINNLTQVESHDKSSENLIKTDPLMLNFVNDASQEPTIYSTLAVRVVWIALERCIESRSSDFSEIVQVVTQIPSISRYLWYFLHRFVCLATSTHSTTFDNEAGWSTRMAAGLYVLCEIALRRPADRCRAIGLLLHYASCDINSCRNGAVKILTRELYAQLLTEDKKLIEIGGLHPLRNLNALMNSTELMNPQHRWNDKSDPLRITSELESFTDSKHVEGLVQRKLSLYFGLCIASPDLICELFEAYAKIPDRASQIRNAILNLPEVARLCISLSQSAEIINSIRKHPEGSEPLTLHFIRILVEFFRKQLSEALDSTLNTSISGRKHDDSENDYSAALEIVMHACHHCYALTATRQAGRLKSGDTMGSQEKNSCSIDFAKVQFLLPIVSFIPKVKIMNDVLPEVIQTFDLNGDCSFLRWAYQEILRTSTTPQSSTVLSSNECMTPIELLVYLHDTLVSTNVTLASQTTAVREALHLTHGNRNELVYSEHSLGLAFKQIILQTQLPTYLMRTVLIAVSRFPNLLTWVLDNLIPEIIKRKMWEGNSALWAGVSKLVLTYWPRTVQVILALPEDILAKEVQTHHELRSKLVGLMHQGAIAPQYHALIRRHLF